MLQQGKKQVTLSPLTLSEKSCTCEVPQQVTSQGEPMVSLLFTTQRQQQQQLPEAQHMQPNSTSSATSCTTAQTVSSSLP